MQGAQLPFPFGGKQRQVQIDLDLPKLYASGLTPNDVSNALNAQNLILPAGTAKMGDTEFGVRLNSSLPSRSPNSPICPSKTVNGTTVYVRDVASVRDGATRRRPAWSTPAAGARR